MSTMACLATFLLICVLPLSFAYRRAVETTWRTSGPALVLHQSNHSINGQANTTTNFSAEGSNIPWSTKIQGPLSKAETSLGKGSCGEVTLHKIVLDACRDESVAVKTMKLEAGNEYGFCRELDSLLQLRGNVHINRLIDYWPRRFCDSVRVSTTWKEPKPDYVYFLLEIAHGDTLGTLGRHWDPPKSLIWRLIFGSNTKQREAKGKLSNQLLTMLLRDLLDGLRYMHSKNIMHRDIKPDNIFGIDQSLSDCMEDLSCRFVLGDLGLAGNSDIFGASGIVGTFAWLPPEIRLGVAREWTAAGDVWALGASISAFLTNSMARNIVEVMPLIQEAINDKTYFDDNLKKLLFLMTHSDPEKRPTAEEAFQAVQASLRPEERFGREKSKASADENEVFQKSCLGDCLSQDDGCTKVS